MSDTSGKRGIPTWLASAVIVLAIIGGGYLAYYLIWERSGVDADSIAVDPPRWARAREPSPPKAEYPEGVRLARDGKQIICRNGHALVRGIPNASGDYDVTLNYIVGVRERWLNTEQDKLLDLGLRAVGTPALAEHMGVTPQQQSEIAALPQRVNLSSKENNELRGKIMAWATAKNPVDKAKAGDALMSAVNRIGGARIAEAEQVYKSRAQRIGEILSKEQIQRGTTWVTGP